MAWLEALRRGCSANGRVRTGAFICITTTGVVAVPGAGGGSAMPGPAKRRPPRAPRRRRQGRRAAPSARTRCWAGAPRPPPSLIVTEGARLHLTPQGLFLVAPAPPKSCVKPQKKACPGDIFPRIYCNCDVSYKDLFRDIYRRHSLITKLLSHSSPATELPKGDFISRN